MAVIFLDPKSQAAMAKAHVAGYTKNDGTYVPPHDTKTPSAKAKQLALFKKPAAAQAKGGDETVNQLDHAVAQHHPKAMMHPQEGEHGKAIIINEPSEASAPVTWSDPKAVATFVPDGDVPDELNGVAMAPWEAAPATSEGWAAVDGQLADLEEPPMPAARRWDGKFKDRAAGVIIEEPDGRVWVMRPTNQYGGYEATFPKGRVEPGVSLQAVAIKETFEETGLQVEITGYWGDIERTQTVARYYRARRVGGSPAHMGWEAQAVQLVPKDQLANILNTAVDHKIISISS